MHIGNQVPHPYRTQLARRLRLSESQVTVQCPDIGGGFGQKIALYREELTVAALARALRRPVRWREDRAENLLAASHAREDRGAHARRRRPRRGASWRSSSRSPRTLAPTASIRRTTSRAWSRMILTGPYRIADYAYDIKVALTNKCGNGPMRAPMAIASWVMDGTIEAIARRLEARPDRGPPHQHAAGVRSALSHADRRGASRTSRRARRWSARSKLSTFAAFRARQAADRRRGIYRGLGVCCVVESDDLWLGFLQGRRHSRLRS